MIWHEKEDIQKLEEVIREICAEECWALPAHVRRKENPNWRGVIDLFASETGQTLAHIITLLKDELSEDVIALAQNEVKARILKPFIESRCHMQAGNRQRITGMLFVVVMWEVQLFFL